MIGFSELDGCFAITYESGVFRQRPVFERLNVAYVSQKGGYLRMAKNGKTSHPKVTWVGVDGFDFAFGRHEYMEVLNGAR